MNLYRLLLLLICAIGVATLSGFMFNIRKPWFGLALLIVAVVMTVLAGVVVTTGVPTP